MRQLLDTLREQNAAAVEDVVPEKVGVGEVQRVLQHLLREGVSIRDLGAILEAIGDRAALTRDPALLAEAARQALARTITGGYLDAEPALRAISFEPDLEHEVPESLPQTPEGERLAIEPARAEALLAPSAARSSAPPPLGGRPVMLCSSRIRRHVRCVVEQAFPQLPVLSYNEILPGIRVEPTGLVVSA